MTSRRVFLKSGGAALVSLGFAPSFLARTVDAAGTRKKLLIAIFQRGAVDGLNMVVPYGDAGYYAARPTIAIARPGRSDGALDLDGFFGLHPRMAPLAPWWTSGQLAVVHASGSPDTTRSHFDAQDYMESATPGVIPASATRQQARSPRFMPRSLPPVRRATGRSEHAAQSTPRNADARTVCPGNTAPAFQYR